MKYLKKYDSLILEKLLNPIDEYVLPLVDLGFEVKLDGSNIGKLKLNLKSDKLTDEIRLEIFNEYLTMIDRLKDDWDITTHNILFIEDNDITISLRRKIKNTFDEIEMSPEQKVAYDAIELSIPVDSLLNLCNVSNDSISFSLKKDSHSIWSWITINKDGRINLPILRGFKSKNLTDLPFNNSDIEWFKRIIEINDKYSKDTNDEMDDLHRKTQQELREIYK